MYSYNKFVRSSEKGYKMIKIFFALSLFVSNYILSSAYQVQAPAQKQVAAQDEKEDTSVVAQAAQTVQSTSQAIVAAVQNTSLNWLHVLKRYWVTYESTKQIADIEMHSDKKAASGK